MSLKCLKPHILLWCAVPSITTGGAQRPSRTFCSTKFFVTCPPELFTCLLLQWRILGCVWGGREAVLELPHAPALNPLCAKDQSSAACARVHCCLQRMHTHFVCLERGSVGCTKRMNTQSGTHTLASAVKRLVMLPESRGYISPAGRAAALQRDRQDSKQLTSLLPWHASARTGEGRRRRRCVRVCERVLYGVLLWD